jgi:hypothetical protein
VRESTAGVTNIPATTDTLDADTADATRTLTDTVYKSKADATKTSTTADTGDEIEVQDSNDEVSTSISVSYENATPSTITQRAAASQTSRIDGVWGHSEEDSAEAEFHSSPTMAEEGWVRASPASLLESTPDVVNSTVPWTIIASVLGGVAVALGIILTLCKLCKKKPSHDSDSTYYSQFDENDDDRGPAQILNITQ